MEETKMMIRGQRASGIEGGRKSALNTASSRLCWRLRAMLAGLSILVLAPGASLAKDYCISFTAFPGSEIVGRGFTVPGKGQFKPFTGFFLPGENDAAAGTGCTSTDGSNLSFTITTSAPESGGAAFIDSISLSLPAHSGECSQTNLSSSSISFASFAVTGKPCSKVAIPAADSEAVPQPGGPHSLVR